MYEYILQLVTVAAQKKNLKESTIHTYRQSLKHFFKLTGKSWKELTIADADNFLTAKRLAGAMPETYNHYYAALRFMYKRVLKLNWNYKDLPDVERKRNGTLYQMTTSQHRLARALIRRECCSYEEGNCMELDDGESHSCIQCHTPSGSCKWFRFAVLPLLKILEAEIFKDRDTKACVITLKSRSTLPKKEKHSRI